MKLTTIALATAFALSGAAAVANTVHHRSDVRIDRDAAGVVRLHPNYGNPAIQTVRPRWAGPGPPRSVAPRLAPAATTENALHLRGANRPNKYGDKVGRVKPLRQLRPCNRN